EPTEEGERGLHRVRAEEDPPHANERERRRALTESLEPALLTFPRLRVLHLGVRGSPSGTPLVGREQAAVIRTPEHEGPRRAVPEPSEDHRDHDVQVRPAPSPPIPTERDVEVVPEPSGQGHVPATPELLDRPSGVGTVEVPRELETQE